MKTLLKYIITIAVGAIITVLVSLHQGLSSAPGAAMACRHISDGCFVAGIILTGVGAMTWISTTGFFDIFSYAFHSFLALFTALRTPKENGTFLDYKTMKAEKRKKPLRYIMFVGIGFIVLSAVLVAMYYKI